MIDSRGRVVQEELTRVDPKDPLSGYLNAVVQLGSGGKLGGVAGALLNWGFGWIMLGMTGLGFFLSFPQKRSEPALETDE